MKKMALVLAFVLFVCTLVPALAVSPADILGVWYLKSVEYNSNFQAVMEGDYRVEFNRDRSALLVRNGEEEKTTWEIQDDGAEMKLEDSSRTFELLEDGTLKASLKIYDKYYHDCIFSREKEELQIPAVIDAASEEDYFGTYAITLQKIGNIVIPIENGETALKAVIEYALVTISGETVSEKAIMSDYQEGKVIIPAYGVLNNATEENKLFIGKTETGIVVTCDGMPDESYYLSPVDGAENAEEGTGE